MNLQVSFRHFVNNKHEHNYKVCTLMIGALTVVTVHLSWEEKL